MKKLILFFILFPALAFAQLATSLDTHPATGNSGLDVFTYPINSYNSGVAAWPKSSSIPDNPSGSGKLAGAFGGDIATGDAYAICEDDYLSIFPGCWGNVYGAAMHGNRIGPVIYQVNKCINCDGGIGGPGFILWPDRSNADHSGNRGYLDIWAWGQNDSGFSNTINFGNRDSSGAAHRRLRILNTGKVNIPDLAGSGNAHLCIDSAGSIYRGTASGC